MKKNLLENLVVTEGLGQPFNGAYQDFVLQCPAPQFFNRAAAYALDGILVGLLDQLLTLGLSLIIYFSPVAWIPPLAALVQFLGGVTSYFLFHAVRAYCTHRFGASPGKLLLHIRNVEAHGGHMSFPVALLREVITLISFFTVIGILMAAFREDKKTLHDLMTATTVHDLREWLP